MKELEEAIAGAFCRKYKMVFERIEGQKYNFRFYSSGDGMEKEDYRGSAIVMRIYGTLADVDPKDIEAMFWGDPKAIVLIGFNDVAAFRAADRINFTVISDRKGLYA